MNERNRGNTGLLASVSTLAEARVVFDAGADIIDLKSPADGALGALDVDRVEAIVRQFGDAAPISATIGDLPMVPSRVKEAVRAMSATGVDFVKIGMFPEGDLHATIAALARIGGGTRLVAVLFADRRPDLALIGELAEAGFAGVMLDTIDKNAGSLRTVCSRDKLHAFVDAARARGLLCGLAGSLRLEDIAPLLALAPDYLGFRGALCRAHQRTQAVDRAAVERIRASIPAAVVA